ncbi:MAG: heat-inducible transcriptional repressor HrcA [Pseudomonadota bacterium]
MPKGLSEREKLILSAVIATYIAAAEPVGSRTVSKLQGVNVSPATIRNVMADLEEMGYLAQPHVSAGRVPTPQGLRFYVDSILEVRDLDEPFKARINRALRGQEEADLRHVLKATGRLLSAVSQQAAVVAAPAPAQAPEQEFFRRMEFVLLQPGLILVVLSARGGHVENRIIEAEAELSQDELDRFTRYLNELLADLTLNEVRERLEREMTREKVRFDRVMGRALRLGRRAFPQGEAGDVYLEGQANLLGVPEFTDVARLKVIFQAFEERSTLLRLLERSLTAPGVQILMASEAEMTGLEGLTAVTASYGNVERPAGALGVIGPTRMDYSKIIPLVDYTARLVSRILGSRD